MKSTVEQTFYLLSNSSLHLIQLFSIDIMSATTGSTGFKSSEWLTKLSEAREQVVAISNMKNAGAILVTAVQAFGDALVCRTYSSIRIYIY